MPIVLPAGVYPEVISDQNLLSGPRHTVFEYELMEKGPNNQDILIGPLEGVLPGGSVEWSSSASIKGSGQITVRDIGQDIDWYKARIRIRATITGPNQDSLEFNLGTWIPAAPTETWTDTGRVWDIELLDKLAIIDRSVVADVDGNASAIAFSAGTNIIDQVFLLLHAALEHDMLFDPDTKVLSAPMVFPAGTPRLKIINDLLDAANYFSLWTDHNGMFRCTPYTRPEDRSPKFVTEGTFIEGDRSIVSPEWSKDVDFFDIPNRVVAIQQGSGEEAGLVATANNTDPASPFSYPSRGNVWVTKVYEGVEAADMSVLQAYADRMLKTLSNTSAGASIQHLLVPNLLVNDVIRFVSPGMNANCSVSKTSIELDSLGWCSTELVEVKSFA